MQNRQKKPGLMDQMMNPVWMQAGNVVNENKRIKGSSRRNNLRFVILALVFFIAGIAFYCSLPLLGKGLQWLLERI